MRVLDAHGTPLGEVADIENETETDTRRVAVLLTDGRRVVASVHRAEVVDHGRSRTLKLPYDERQLLSGITAES